jgi:hypothetical protein
MPTPVMVLAMGAVRGAALASRMLILAMALAMVAARARRP